MSISVNKANERETSAEPGGFKFFNVENRAMYLASLLGRPFYVGEIGPMAFNKSPIVVVDRPEEELCDILSCGVFPTMRGMRYFRASELLSAWAEGVEAVRVRWR